MDKDHLAAASNGSPGGAKVGRSVGDLQVWWVPQVPMPSFTFDVPDVATGALLMEALAEYDAFQFRHRVKPDYCNAGGLQRWCDDNGEGEPGWEDWYDEETGDDIDDVLRSIRRGFA